MMFSLNNIFKQNIFLTFDKLRNVKLKMNNYVFNKRFSKMFRCIINLLISINTSKCNIKRNN
jgi:hypothetical protein